MTSATKILVNNIFSLSFLHGLNYLLPMLMVPYLLRVLGSELYGILALATSTMTIFMVLSDYGFNLTATKRVSVNRNNFHQLKNIYSSVLGVKFLLLLFCFLGLILLSNSVEKIHIMKHVYFASFGTVLGSVLYPVWFFQGIEKMKYLAIIDGISKFISYSSIFLVVKRPEDYLLVPLIISSGSILTGILAQTFIYFRFKLFLTLQPVNSYLNQLKDGWHVFISSIGPTMYTHGSIFITGLFVDNTLIAYFSASEKIVRAGKKLYAPIGQAAFPSLSRKLDEDTRGGLRFILRLSVLVASAMIIISSLIYIYSEDIMFMVLGFKDDMAIRILQIMSFIPFLYTANNIIGVQTMINLDYKKEYSRIVLLGTLVSLFVSYLLTKEFEIIGASYAILFTEILLLIMLAFQLIIILIKFGAKRSK